MEIIFATSNQHKLAEIQAIIGEEIKIIGLNEIGFNDEIPETNPTIEGNAIQKAQYIFERYKKPVFADDTGLEVDSLNGEPGVYSARYAGINCSYDDNVNLLLKNLNKVSLRTARFKTVIALCLSENSNELFEGIIDGEITTEKSGNGGFGYDPIFSPKGYQQTFSEMSSTIKNKISHRAIATQKLINFLNQLNLN